MKLAVILVTYKSPKKELERLREEIKRTKIRHKLYLFDNSRHNIGFAAAANRGIVQALKDGKDLFLLLNHDVSLINLTARDIGDARFMYDIFGGAFRQGDKTYFGGKIDYLSMSGGLIDNKPPSRFSSCDFVSGSMMFINKKTVDKIGFLDEQYFLYYEDVEYCYRATKAGLRVGINTAIEYEHFEISKKFTEKEYYLTRNRLLFAREHGNFLQKTYLALKTPLQIKRIRHSKNSKDRQILQGYRDYLDIVNHDRQEVSA